MGEEPHPIDELRKLDPASLKVVMMDGTERAVPVPRVRNRWQRVHQVIDSLPWSRVEALDKSGGMLGVVEAAGEAEAEIEDDGGVDGVSVERMTRLALETGLRMCREQREGFSVQMRSMNEMLGQIMQAQQVLIQSYQESMSVQRATILAEAADGKPGDNPAINMLMQMAMAQMARAGQSAPQIATAQSQKKG